MLWSLWLGVLSISAALLRRNSGRIEQRASAVRARSPARSALLVAIGTLGGTGCCRQVSAASPSEAPRSDANAPQAPRYPGELVDVSEIRGAFMWEQEIVTSYGGLSRSLRAVVQKSGEGLDVIGLTPFGTRAFLLSQRGKTHSFESFVDEALPFEPRAILLDVHRVFFLALARPESGDGHITGELFGEQVSETWRDGRLFERRFRRPGGPAGEIVITYAGGMRGLKPARQIELENEWYGYHLEITTLSARGLLSE